MHVRFALYKIICRTKTNEIVQLNSKLDQVVVWLIPSPHPTERGLGTQKYEVKDNHGSLSDSFFDYFSESISDSILNPFWIRFGVKLGSPNRLRSIKYQCHDVLPSRLVWLPTSKLGSIKHVCFYLVIPKCFKSPSHVHFDFCRNVGVHLSPFFVHR